MSDQKSDNNLIIMALGRIEDTCINMNQEVGRMKDDMSEMKITQAKHHVVLEEHIKRTALNEQQIEAMKSELKPIKIHVAMWGGASKLLTILALIAGVTYYIFRITS